MSSADMGVSVQLAEGLSSSWNELALRSGNIFSTYDWAQLWREHVRPVNEPFVAVTISREGRLLGIVPLASSRIGPLRLVTFMGHGLADELGPVCDPADLLDVAPLLSAAVRAFRADADLFVGDAMPGSIDWAERITGRVLAREASPVIRIRGRSWDEFLAERSRNFRKDVRATERRMLNVSGAKMRRVEDSADLPQALDWLFKLHRIRWGSGSQFARTESFHRAFAAAALSHGWLRLWVLQVGSVPIAVWYGFRFGSAVCGYQSGRDTGWDRYAVGRVLRTRAIRAAMEEGAAEFRFLRGDESHKLRFADHDAGVVSIGLPLSTLGTVSLAGYGAASRAMAITELARLRIGQLGARWAEK